MQHAVLARSRVLVPCLAFAIVTTGAADAQHGFQPGTLRIDVGQQLASACGWVKDAHAKGVPGRSELRSGHENQFCGSKGVCPGEVRRVLAVLERHDPRRNGPCRSVFAAKPKAAREQLSLRITGWRDGHYAWCMNNQGPATAYLCERTSLVRHMVRRVRRA